MNASAYHPRFARRSRREYYSNHARSNEDMGWFRGYASRSNLSRRNPGLFFPSMMHVRPREEKKLCRLQIWDFSPENLPELSVPDVGVLRTRVKFNNDSSCSIASDFSRLACFEQSSGMIFKCFSKKLFSLK